AAPTTVERQVVHWFEARYSPPALQPPHCPAFLIDTGERLLYGTPDLGEGLKAGLHHGEVPEDDAAATGEEGARQVRAILHHHLPAANGRLLRGAVCHYTNTPGSRFIIDQLPGAAPVWVVSPCSGHGFKFATVVGEEVAQWVTNGRPSLDLSPFRLTL